LHAHDDLAPGERVLLLQRAGSAYVQAANAYADAVNPPDTTAIEVASQTLLGAAQAIARRSLDGGLAPKLVMVMRTSVTLQ
jgi:hypothetical protein